VQLAPDIMEGAVVVLVVQVLMEGAIPEVGKVAQV
jgi:hypothetical protein